MGEGAKYKKNIRARENLNEKSHARQMILKNIHAPKKNHTRKMIACVQTSPLPQKKYIFPEGGGTSVHRLGK